MPRKKISIPTLVMIAARSLTHEALKEDEQGFTLRNLKKETMLMAANLEVDEGPIQIRSGRSPVKELLADGEIVRFGRSYRAQGLDDVTLADVLALAKRSVDPGLKLTPGRRRLTTESREVLALTKQQFEKGRAALNKVGQYFRPDLSKAAANAQVGAEYLHWDPSAGVGGLGDWAILEVVREVGTDQHVGDARTIMDLAASHKLITPTERHDPDFCPVPTNWAPLHSAWSSKLTDHPRCQWATYQLFGEVANALGTQRAPTQLSPKDWEAVVNHCEQKWAMTKSLPSTRRSEVRNAYRQLRSDGVIVGPDWDGLQRQKNQAFSAFPGRLNAALAFTYCWDAPDESVRPGYDAPAWDLAPEEIGALVAEGDFSLHRMILHFTETDPKVLEDLRIPPRNVWPRDAHRTLSARSATAYKTSTLKVNLRGLGMYVGFLQKHMGLDFSAETGIELEAILTADLLRAFYHQGNRYTTDEQIRRAMVFLARVASPFGEGVALHARKDRALADRLAQVSKLANSQSGVIVDGERRISYARAAKEKLEKRSQKDIRHDESDIAERTNGAWAEITGEDHGYLGLIEIVKFQRIRLLEELGVETFQEIVESDDFSLSREHSRMIRDVAMLQDNVIAPLRTGSVIKMPHTSRKRVNGKVTGHYPAWILKASDSAEGDLKVTYWNPEAPVSFYDPELFELYADIARGVLCPNPGKRFWVPDVVGREGRHKQWKGISERIPTAVLQRAVNAWADAHDVDPSPVHVIYADMALSIWHRVRHLFGLYWAEQGLVQMAARLLHHASLENIMNIYGRRDASAYNPGALLG